LRELSDRVAAAMAALGLEGDPLVRPSTDPRFGDYQSNCAMGAARRAGGTPREVAEAILGKLDVADCCEPPDVAGPGFINFRLTPAFLARSLGRVPTAGEPGAERLGIDRTDHPTVVVVDLSSPNLAKEMHVGHLRSTVIGDCVARILEFQGHHVIRENHVGDWGTQFGMLVAYLRRTRPNVLDDLDRLVIADLEAFYVEAKSLFDRDEAFKKQSQETVVRLQRGDAETLRIWRAFCNESLRHCHAIYERLNVSLIDRGESFYNDLMPQVIDRLMRDGHARESDGALCVFCDGFQTREGAPLPLIVRKSDGGYNYATSDLATIVHRIETLGARRVIYVVGIAQKLHFDMVFAAARKAGWAGEGVALEHLGFGNVLSASGAPFKTREGGTVKLKSLMDEAVARARSVLESGGVIAAAGADEDAAADRPATGADAARAGMTSQEMDDIAETVGLAAIKYFDLQHNLVKDYKFDLDTMLALDGNTAPYMLYACARVRAIGRKAGIDFDSFCPEGGLVLEHPAEIALAKSLLRFAETIDQAAADLRPNVLTDYLYDLSKQFSRFYDRKQGVRVIDAEPPGVRVSRLRLCDLTARTLKLGLSLLGIRTLERM